MTKIARAQQPVWGSQIWLMQIQLLVTLLAKRIFGGDCGCHL
jgi:hypothetical protein